MPDIIYDIYVWINIASFVVTIVDKIFWGSLAPVFWLGTLAFGGLGSTVGCFLSRHRTSNGDVGVAVFLTVIQFGLLYLLERIF